MFRVELERRQRPAQSLARLIDSRVVQVAVRCGCAHRGRAKADLRLGDDLVWLGLVGARLADGAADLLDIVAIDALDGPAVA